MSELDEILLAPVERLAARVPELTEDPTEEDLILARSCLETASVKARSIGSSSWNAGTVPPEVAINVLEAAARGFMNPGGFVREKADQVTLERHATYTQGVFFTPSEEAEIRRAAGIHSVSYSDSTRNDMFRARSDGPAERTIYALWGGVGRKVPFWEVRG